MRRLYLFRHQTERVSLYAVTTRPPHLQVGLVRSQDPDAHGDPVPYVHCVDEVIALLCREGVERPDGFGVVLPLGGYQAIDIDLVGDVVVPPDLRALARYQRAHDRQQLRDLKQG